ncbi:MULTISPECIES: hypothetical protein [Halorussus]|uniref:hypothetical protein n=1 Tax=Halorussus TaxID=1070314 RepID=UPI00209F8B00|nr:hypothetical protein [Halorussus vallis]USZ73948.1 hypothetical protein NGM07_10810 [Halorussus vallis]
MIATALRTRIVICVVLCNCLALTVPASAVSGTPVASATTAPSTDEPISSGDSFCAGERLGFEIRNSTQNAGKSYEIRTATDSQKLAAQVWVRENGTGVVDTTALATDGEAKSYFVADGDGTPIVFEGGRSVKAGNITEAKWTVRSEPCAKFPDRLVGVWDWPYETQLFVGGDAEAVEITSETMNATELAAVFGGTKTADGVRVDVADRQTVPATFQYRHTDEHVFHVSAVGGDANATAWLTLVTFPVPPVKFTSDDVIRGGRNGTAEVSLAFEGPRVATVTASRGDVRLHATVRDADRDENVTLRYDVNAMGSITGETSDETAAEAVDVAGDDRLLSVNVSESPGSRTHGEYELELAKSRDGEVVDVTILRVVESERSGETQRTDDSPTTKRNETAVTETPTDGASPTTEGDATAEETNGSEATTDESATSAVPGFGLGAGLAAVAVALGLAAVRRR